MAVIFPTLGIITKLESDVPQIGEITSSIQSGRVKIISPKKVDGKISDILCYLTATLPALPPGSCLHAPTGWGHASEHTPQSPWENTKNCWANIIYPLLYLPVSFLVKLHPEEDVLPDSAAEHPGLLGRVGDVPGDGHTALIAGELPQHRLNDGALAWPHRADDGNLNNNKEN